MGVDEVEALAHEGFFVVEDHAGEIDEALGVDEEADRRGFGERGVEVRLGEGIDAVTLAWLGVELDGVAEAGAAASSDADAEAAGFGSDVLLGHGDADALEGAEGELDALGAGGLAFGGEDGGRWGRLDRGCGYGAFGGFGLEGDHGHMSVMKLSGEAESLLRFSGFLRRPYPAFIPQTEKDGDDNYQTYVER